MARESAAAVVSRLSASSSGVFRGRDAVARGVSRKQLGTLAAAGVILGELAAVLDDEALEIACEDARRRRLTSVAALRNYLARFRAPGRAGSRRLDRLLDELDPAHAARSTLEVKARRLLATHGITGFVRE